jgi:hypothetical protein
MLSQKRFSIILFVCVILGIVGFLMAYESFNYDVTITNKHDKDYWIKIWTMKNHPELYWNYFHGLWLIPFGIMFAFILLLLDLPSYEDIYKHLKKDFKNIKK